MLIESARVGVALHGDQAAHVGGATHVFIDDLADARLFLHRRSRGVLTRVEPGVGRPLMSLQAGRQHGQFRQNLHGAGAFIPLRVALECHHEYLSTHRLALTTQGGIYPLLLVWSTGSLPVVLHAVAITLRRG